MRGWSLGERLKRSYKTIPELQVEDEALLWIEHRSHIFNDKWAG